MSKRHSAYNSYWSLGRASMPCPHFPMSFDYGLLSFSCCHRSLSLLLSRSYSLTRLLENGHSSINLEPIAREAKRMKRKTRDHDTVEDGACKVALGEGYKRTRRRRSRFWITGPSVRNFQRVRQNANSPTEATHVGESGNASEAQRAEKTCVREIEKQRDADDRA